VVDIPSIGGCRVLMDTREAALAELGRVFRLIVEEHQERDQPLPKDTTEIVQA
jgi:predicted RNase H-like HicB family nuclease